MPTTVQLTAAQDAAQMVSMMTEAQGFMRPQERSGKPLSTQSGSGLEGAFGNALMDKLGIHATYEVAPTVAVVADTQVAETVSYWVTHGVQSAELTLDGFGNEPVEVRISLDGDQAQIDFWSNQADVRQVLEDASAQLKEMLSREGLQLTGMSVGTSGRERGQSEGDQPKQSSIRQAKLSSVEPLVTTMTRSANRAVGQSLDLYV
jgi:flagellar hook-length control protein FliK